MDWIDVAQDRDQWRSLVKGNKPSGSKKCWEILLTKRLAASQEGLSSMNVVT
jgi:hypothetical protein